MTFTRRPDESNNDALARYEEEILAAGPMGWLERPDAMRAFLASTFTNGLGAWKTKGTTCALFQGGALQGCGVQERHPLPTIYGITTWMKASWFSGPEWVSAERILAGVDRIIRGDILYFAGNNDPLQSPRIWHAATNGHVECACEGEGLSWSTAAGGGANGRCALSDGRKDVSSSWHRALRGAWRPNHMASARHAEADTIPAPPPPPSAPPPHRVLRQGMNGDDVDEARRLLGMSPGQLFDWAMFNAVEAYQRAHGLTIDGVIGNRETWPELLKGSL